jgi:hypothetical protein
MPAALFGITNDSLNLVVNLLILFLVVLWVALVAWTFFDARRRIADPILVASATAASLFPFLGTIVYSILRPPEFLADKRERELEIRASELRVRQLEEASCPNCEHPVERTFLRCPNCRARIKDPCESCGKPIDPRWSICPYCETPQRSAAPPERRPASGKRRSKSSAGAEAPPKSSRSSKAPTRSATRSAGRSNSAAEKGSAPPPDGDTKRQPTPTPTPTRSPRSVRSGSTGRPSSSSSKRGE